MTPTEQPDGAAWKSLVALAEKLHGPDADRFLAGKLCEALDSTPQADLAESIQRAATLVAGNPRAPGLIMHLGARKQRNSRRLALAIVSRMRMPLEENLLATVRVLFHRKRAPMADQVAALDAIFKSSQGEMGQAGVLLDAYVARCRRKVAIARLELLARRVGDHELIAQRRRKIASQVRLRCPRCRLQLRRPFMSRHLWTEHKLMLDGSKVRKPWQMIEAWIEEYQRTGNRQLLTRSRALAGRLDPDHGGERVRRLERS